MYQELGAAGNSGEMGGSHLNTKPSFKSRYHDTIMDQEMKMREDNVLKLEEKKRMAEKKNNYAKFVKEMHVP